MSDEAFDSALTFVLRWEGGFVDNPADPGGRTNRGITQQVYDAWRSKQGKPSNDVKLIDEAEIVAIYQTEYWLAARCDTLDANLATVEFDTAVNMGVGRAVRFLQMAVGCNPDGAFGPATQSAVSTCDRGAALVAYCDAREKYYGGLVEAKPSLSVFMKGWMNRLNALRAQVGLPGYEGTATVDSGDTVFIAKVPELDTDPLAPVGTAKSLEQLRSETVQAMGRLNGLRSAEHLDAIKPLVEELRNVREFDLMGKLAEAIRRVDGKDLKNRRLYAQYLIETGKVTAAIDVLQLLVRDLKSAHPEYPEAMGLLGRAHKQLFFDAGDKSSPSAKRAWQEAILAYRKPFETSPANTWHGVNLLALLANGKRLGIRAPAGLELSAIAKQVVSALDAIPAAKRDEWYLPTLAEAYLGLEDWDAVERHVREYAASPDAKAFLLASTLRQFTKIWRVDEVAERGRGLINILRARLSQLPGGGLEIPAADIRRLRAEPAPAPGQLEAVLGTQGPETYRWWKLGLDRALSVGAVRRRLGNRVGTGFLVAAGDLGLKPAEELVFLTNSHVVNQHGAAPGVAPEEAEVVFEAVDAARSYPVKCILWSSPQEQGDASVLQFDSPVKNVLPLPFASTLPPLKDNPRVYVIGYPGGHDLAFSFQDNELLAHEGPPAGRPQIPGICRVHYRAATEGGSSGSPVFNARAWEVIALHHRGGKMGMPKLNGEPGTYAANEGISIGSIAALSKSILESP
jgi:lysozyme family protein/S1-C subfamily serine protease